MPAQGNGRREHVLDDVVHLVPVRGGHAAGGRRGRPHPRRAGAPLAGAARPGGVLGQPRREPARLRRRARRPATRRRPAADDHRRGRRDRRRDGHRQRHGRALRDPGRPHRCPGDGRAAGPVRRRAVVDPLRAERRAAHRLGHVRAGGDRAGGHARRRGPDLGVGARGRGGDDAADAAPAGHAAAAAPGGDGARRDLRGLPRLVVVHPPRGRRSRADRLVGGVLGGHRRRDRGRGLVDPGRLGLLPALAAGRHRVHRGHRRLRPHADPLLRRGARGAVAGRRERRRGLRADARRAARAGRAAWS